VDCQQAQELKDAEAELSQLTATTPQASEVKLAVKCEVESPGTSLEKAGIDAILSTNPDSQGWQLWSRAALQSWATSNPIDLESDVEMSPTGDLDGVPMLIWAISLKEVDRCMDIVLFLETNCSPLQIFEGHHHFHILVIGDSRGYNITSGYNITTKHHLVEVYTWI
jgi:hypothetical protein